MKRIALVTGITGFIGSHLAAALLNEEWEVHAIVRRHSKIETLPKGVQDHVVFYQLDEYPDMIEILHLAKPTVVFHLASLFLAQHGYDDIEPLMESNLTFGTKLLEAMAQMGIRAFINTGTAWQHYANEEYNPVNLYAATKQAFEAILRYYQELGQIDVITLQLSDTYGENDTRKKLLALLKNTAESGKKLAMSPGEQKIDLVHVEDVVSAYILAAKYIVMGKTEFLGSYAVTSGTAISLRELAERYSQLIGKKIHIEWGGRPYRRREVMIPWTKGVILPGWKRIRMELM